MSARIHLKKPKSKMKPRVKRNKYDSGWKKIIRQLFKDFLEFFFPDIHDTIDFSEKIVFLDKELLEIDPNSKLGDREADVLVKVHLKKEYGSKINLIHIIAHIEVEGQEPIHFMERMFVYFYRTYDKEKQDNIKIISLAIFTDSNPAFRPADYIYEFCDFKLSMHIPIVKVLDYKYNPELIEKLETSANPMALVVKAQLKSMELKGEDSNKKFEALKELIRLCYQKDYAREYTRVLLKFFELAIRLPDAYNQSISQVILKSEEEFKMEYIPSWEREADKRGYRRGAKNGKKIGERKSREQIARNMIEIGLDIEKIVKVTGLTKEEVEKLSPTVH